MGVDGVRIEPTASGLEVVAGTYRLMIFPERARCELRDAAGEYQGSLSLLADLDTTAGLDATEAVSAADRIESGSGAPALALRLQSVRWASKRVVLTFEPEEFRLRLEVGDASDRALAVSSSIALTDCRLLGGRWVGGGRHGTGDQWSRIEAGTLFCPAPEDPRRVARNPAEAAVIGVTGSSLPGRGHWFFTPAPFCFGLSPQPSADVRVLPAGPWTMLGVAADVRTAGFTGLHFEPSDGAFALRLAYEGQTPIDGSWTSPELIVRPSVENPYTGLAAHRATLEHLGRASASARAPQAWWREPIFCGWGAQCHLAKLDGSHPRDHARQTNYDAWLAGLEDRGIVPGTIVIDDRWQADYGSGSVDEDKWPNLAGWIAGRHARGQRVLLWWKAWDPEGLAEEWCVTTPDGRPVAADPSNPAYRSFLAEVIRGLLAPDGLGVDGLKIDFTAQTPSGPGLRRHGREWGVSLLHLLLRTIHDAAREARPDALVVAHAPNPGFSDVAGMVRLNDILRLEDPDLAQVDVVAQMRYRAEVTRAACPDLLIETDDWAMPDRAAWRAYLAEKSRLGTPSLYFATHLDVSGEPLGDEDFEAVRESWEEYRVRSGLPPRTAIVPVARVG